MSLWPSNGPRTLGIETIQKIAEQFFQPRDPFDEMVSGALQNLIICCMLIVKSDQIIFSSSLVLLEFGSKSSPGILERTNQ